MIFAVQIASALPLLSGLSIWQNLVLFFLAGICAGRVLTIWIVRLTQATSLRGKARCRNCGQEIALFDRVPVVSYIWLRGRCRTCRQPIGKAVLLTELGTGILFAALVTAVVHLQSQSPVEEGNAPLLWVDWLLWLDWRILFQLTLFTLLVAATAIDLECYLIPDSITIPGTLIGLIGATAGGYLHVVPLWIDWSVASPPVSGPYIPAWIIEHPHWHGLAWSVAGLLVGGGITWLVRVASTVLLGREALGFGDVTLMAMIGSFIGWQPVVLVFLLAPVLGLLAMPFLLFFAGRIAVPYGPFLSAATVVVLLAWRWLWKPTQLLFGHWQSLALLAGVIAATLVLLLGGIRLYRRIPVRGRDGERERGGEGERRM